MNTPQPQSPVKPPRTAGSDAFVVFAFAWSAYAMLHCLVTYLGWFRLSHPEEIIQHLAVIGSAMLVMGRPASVPRFLLLLAAMLFMELWDMPFWPNHIFHTWLVNLTLVCICLAALARRQSDESASAAAGRVFLPVGRLLTLGLYFWVVVHKLNWDYLNPEISCGWVLYTEVVEYMDKFFGVPMPLADWMQYPCLLGALIIEAAIPLLLFFRPTRKAGLLLGLIFHFSLAFHRNEYISSFTMMMYAHFTLYLPARARSNLIDWWAGTRLGRRAATGRGLLISALLAGGLVVYGGLIVVGGVIRNGVGYKAVMDVFHLVTPYAVFFAWFCWMAIAMFVFLRFALRVKAEPIARAYFIPSLVPVLVFPLICFLNGFSPYVGLKTHNAYAMFSNLRTEGGVNNHLFMPTSFRVVDFQDDLVVVHSSNYNKIPATTDGVRMTWFEFRRRLMRAPADVAITYQREGDELKSLTHKDIRKDPALKPENALVRRFVYYKNVPPDDRPCLCRH